MQPAKITTTLKTSSGLFFVQKPKKYQFFCRIPLNEMYFCQKNQQFWFLSFFTTTSIRTWILANLTPLPPPHGAPPSPTHPTTLLYVFASQWVQKMCLFIKNRLAKKNLKLTGHHQLMLILGPFFQAFKWWTTHRTTLGSPPRVFSCSTTPTPCPKPRHRRSEA